METEIICLPAPLGCFKTPSGRNQDTVPPRDEAFLGPLQAEADAAFSRLLDQLGDED